MRKWLKGVGLFGASFGVVFCAVCFANAEESAPAESSVNQALAVAKNLGEVAFAQTERFRFATAARFETKLAEAEAEKQAKLAAVPEAEEDPDEIFVAEPKPVMEQIKDSSGLIEGIKIQAYKALLFVLNSVYAFYGLLGLLALLIIRRMFSRFRGD